MEVLDGELGPCVCVCVFSAPVLLYGLGEYIQMWNEVWRGLHVAPDTVSTRPPVSQISVERDGGTRADL